jgi:GTP-dependent phosphoenolpyruvate carboxykinase
MPKFFDLTFNTKEVVYIIAIISSYIFALTKIDTRQSLMELRQDNLEAKITKIDNQFLVKDEYYVKNLNIIKNNIYKISAILPKEIELETE